MYLYTLETFSYICIYLHLFFFLLSCPFLSRFVFNNITTFIFNSENKTPNSQRIGILEKIMNFLCLHDSYWHSISKKIVSSIIIGKEGTRRYILFSIEKNHNADVNSTGFIYQSSGVSFYSLYIPYNS